jgi:hypothetical protein
MSRDLTWAEQQIASAPSRQVRRQRIRLQAKGRMDVYTPITVDRSKYMPHYGAKERRRFA